MLDRNRRIKPSPEKFQTTPEQFNIIITCEERVYDQVVDCMYKTDFSIKQVFSDGGIQLNFVYYTGLESRDSQTTPVHVINIEIQDNHEEATIGAFLICELVSMVILRIFYFF